MTHSDKFQHAERHHPLIEEIRADILRSFVDMLHDLNADVVSIIKHGRGLHKGNLTLTIGEVNTQLAPVLEHDIVKAVTKKGKERKKPYGHKQYTRKTREGKTVIVEAKGVKPGEEPSEEKPSKTQVAPVKVSWWADEFGNVRCGTKPQGKFKRQVSDAEEKKLYQRLDVMVKFIDDEKMWSDLSGELGVDNRILDTFKEVVNAADQSSQSAEESFVNYFMESAYMPGAWGWSSMSEEEKRKRALELWANLTEAFRAAAESDKWKKRVQGIIKAKKLEAFTVEQAVNRQKNIVKGHFSDIMSGDPHDVSLQQIGILYDLGLFSASNSLRQLMKIQPDEGKARKLIGSMLFDCDRNDMMLDNLDKMTVDQQAAVVCGALAGKCQYMILGNPFRDVDDFWANDFADEFGSLRKLQEQADKTYTDEEWDHVVDRCKSAARQVFDTLQAYNSEQGGYVFKALHHGETDLKKLFKRGAERERLNKLEDDKRSLVQRALAAQSDEDVKLDSSFEKGMKGLKAKLFNFQKWGINWMSTIKSGILAHDAGLGKTPMTIGLVSKLIAEGKVKRGVLVLPPALIEQWPKQIEKWRPGSKVVVIASELGVGAEGKAQKLSLDDRLLKLKAINDGTLDADFVILSAGTMDMTDETRKLLGKHTKAYEDASGKRASKGMIAQTIRDNRLFSNDKLIQEIRKLEGAFFYDEAHSGSQGLKDSSNVSHLIAEEVLKGREYKFGLTATPMVKGPEDLFALANLFHPGSAGESLAKFSNRMVDMSTRYDSDGNPVRIPVARDRNDLIEAKRSISPFCFFLRKSDRRVTNEMEKMGKKLPRVNAVSQPLALSGAALELYDSCQEVGFADTHEPLFKGKDWKTDSEQYQHLLSTVGEASAEASMRARVEARMQRCAISPKLIDKNYTGPQPKIDASIEIIKQHFADPGNANRPVIVFSSWNDSVSLMKQALMDAHVPEHHIGVITGDTPEKERDIIREASNAGKMKVLLINVAAGGAGLDLQGQIDEKTGKPTGSFRSIFLDKPWTPAAMEQAVGRIWRTGQPEDEVHVHHMLVAGAKHDRKKKERIEQRVDLIDSLAFADLADDYISKNINADRARLAGSYDADEMENIKAWSPEQFKAAFARAGLATDDTPMTFDRFKAFRENFDITAYGKTLAAETWKKTGDWKIADMHMMNELKYKNKQITARAYNQRKRAIAVMAKQWMKDMKVASNHPVAVYTGDDFGYTGEGEGATTARKGIVPGKRMGSRPTEKLGEAKTRVAKLVPPKVPIKPKGPITEQHRFKIAAAHTKSNPFKTDSPQWATWEAFRRHKPKSLGEAESVLATWLHSYYADAEDPPNLARCKKGAKKFLREQKFLDKFAKKGMIEVEG